MTQAHSERAHAQWSASATTRNWNCAGALALGAKVANLDVESEAAAWGTACHEVAEKCLRTGLDADSRIGATIKTKSHEIDVDEEMAETAQVYIDYVREQHTGGLPRMVPDNQLWIEERFSLDKINPPFEAGGTCDAIVYNPDQKLLEVTDLKGGRGMKVEVTENKQLRTYALGAMLAHPDLAVEQVRSTIVQPRMHHADGRIRSETFDVLDLLEWTNELKGKMANAKEAEVALAAVKGDLMREAWGDKYLVAGDHCTFCPAAGICPKLEKTAMGRANAFFNDAGKVELRNQPDELDPARLAKLLDGADLITGFLNAARGLAASLAESGTDIYDPESGSRYILVDKIGRRRFKDDTAITALAVLGVPDTALYQRKASSPAQVEKALGAKGLKPIKAQFDALVEKPITGKSLVNAAKTDKPAVKGRAEAFFA